MSGHSPEVIAKKLEEAGRLAAAGKSKREIAKEIGVSTATLKKWSEKYDGMSADVIAQIQELEAEIAEAKRQVKNTSAELGAAQLFIKNFKEGKF
ncbi:MAG: transposase [Corynebacterium sp.]|nr:transposase [Corynebacterium sp.]